MTAIQVNSPVLAEMSSESNANNTTSVDSKILDFWKQFNQDLKAYISDLSDDSKTTVRIQGHVVDKNGAAATFLADQWNSETSFVIDSMMTRLKQETDLLTKLTS